MAGKKALVQYAQGQVAQIQAGDTLLLDVATAVSAAGATQGTATALTKEYTQVTTVAASTGVILPASTVGTSYTVTNRGANSLKIYPPTSSQIDALGTNVAYTLAVGGVMQFDCVTTTLWYSNSAAASSATNIAAGAANQIPYQSGASTTVFMTSVNGAVVNTSATGVPSLTASPLLGVAGTAAGTLRLSGATSGVVTIATAAIAGTYTLTLPASVGTNGQLVYSTGSAWAYVSAGATTAILVGGGAAAPVWTTATGTGAPVRATSPQFTSAIGINVASASQYMCYVGGNATGFTIMEAFRATPAIQSSVTSAYAGFESGPSTQATAFTLANLYHFIASDTVKGAGSTITNQYGFIAGNMTTGGSNYGFFSNVAAAATSWNFYAANTAKNHFAGTVLIGTTTDDGVNKLQVTGSIITSGQCKANQDFVSTTTTAVLASTGAGTVALRPQGAGSSAGQCTLSSDGYWHVYPTGSGGVEVWAQAGVAAFTAIASGNNIAYYAMQNITTGVLCRIEGGVDTMYLQTGTSSTVRTTINATGLTQAGTISDSIGNVRVAVQNNQNANYTLVAADSGKCIGKNNTTAYTHTIPANSSVPYTIGTMLTFYNDSATNNLSIAITTDTMYLAGTTTTGTRTLAPRGIATAIKIASTVWYISGSGLT